MQCNVQYGNVIKYIYKCSTKQYSTTQHKTVGQLNNIE